MHAQHLQTICPCLMSDSEWIALESLEDDTSRFIFDDTMLDVLRDRGLVEPKNGRWRVTNDGNRALSERVFPPRRLL